MSISGQILMRLVVCWAAVIVLCLPAFPETTIPDGEGREVGNALSWQAVIPATANSPGRFGAHYKTRVVIFNPTSRGYTITARLYNANGQARQNEIRIDARGYLVWNNFLEAVFDYSGGGAVWLKADDQGDLFYMTAEVYTDSDNGRFSTTVVSGIIPTCVSSSQPDFNVGINANRNRRTNIGVWNWETKPSLVEAKVFNGSGNLLQTITFDLKAKAWQQKNISASVSNGWVRWEINGESKTHYFYAVEVDNRSNDGTLNWSVNGSTASGDLCGSTSSLQQWLAVSSERGEGIWRAGNIPTESGGPSIINLAANRSVVTGGTSKVTLTTASAAGSIILAETGTDHGYYEIPASGGTTETLTLLFDQDVPTDLVGLSLAAKDASNSVGRFTDVTFEVIEVGTGDLQVTLSWNVDSDVDLYVVDPSGEEIYYSNRRSRSGGELDLDSNAGCEIDGIRNENITWPTGLAPRGVYTVRVNYWSSCGVAATDYTVRVNNGGDSRTFSGTLTGAGNGGGSGAGIEVMTFERTVGPSAESAVRGSAAPRNPRKQKSGISQGNSAGGGGGDGISEGNSAGDPMVFDGIEFVWIPPGELVMGSTSQHADPDEQPLTRARLSRGFWMGKYEVTQSQWEAVMGNNPSYFTNCGGDCPVQNVSRSDAQEFIRRLNARPGGGKYRLPAEAEWEYAARAGTTTNTYAGDITQPPGDHPALKGIVWYAGNSGDRPQPVGRKAPNRWGLYDMLGNVWELVADWYGSYPGGTVTDPVGPPSGTFRVARGGGWRSRARYCRAASRSWGSPSGGSSDLGLRLVRDE